MTTDREKKLPVWAQDLLAEARTASALSWPTVTEPSPIACYDASGHPTGQRLVSITAWNMIGEVVEPCLFNSHGFIVRGTHAFVSRPFSAYYATKEEALAALWWKKAREAAATLHFIRQQLLDSTRE